MGNLYKGISLKNFGPIVLKLHFCNTIPNVHEYQRNRCIMLSWLITQKVDTNRIQITEIRTAIVAKF